MRRAASRKHWALGASARAPMRATATSATSRAWKKRPASVARRRISRGGEELEDLDDAAVAPEAAERLEGEAEQVEHTAEAGAFLDIAV
mmetsp:Transcript_76315/g.220505  ORF Transcript_76315/g.220505 Transcript_76315/m.220505 type:complete len:89 (+) Transcript_76315:968-1234(+)